MRAFPFATSHDAAASFGFRVEAPDGDALGYITDSGIVTSTAHSALRDVRILALESNHDERMLQSGDYPYVIKQRIASEFGHLSNLQATEELAALITESRAAGLRTPEAVVAMHISQNNNDYDLPRAATRERTCHCREQCARPLRLPRTPHEREIAPGKELPSTARPQRCAWEAPSNDK